MHRIRFLAVAIIVYLALFSLTATAEPMVAKKLFPGYQPALVIDSVRNILHLVYADREQLIYRQGTLEGKFGRKELILPKEMRFKPGKKVTWPWGSYMSPQLALDRKGDIHLVFARGLYKKAQSFYTRRTNGSWTAPLRFPRDADSYNRSVNPMLALDSAGTVFTTSFTLSPHCAALSRIVQTDSGPQIDRQVNAAFSFGSPGVFVNGAGELWLFGGNHGDKPWGLQHYDPTTLDTIGSPIDLAPFPGEQARASLDHQGRFHAAGGKLWSRNEPQVGGWYQNSARALERLEPLRYKQTMQHASGMALPLRDRVAENKVYIFYWSGVDGDKHGEIPAIDTNGVAWYFARYPEARLHYSVIQNDSVIVNHQPLSELSGPHGLPFRTTPAAAPLNTGGMVVIFARCKSQKVYDTELYLTTLK